MTLCWVGIAQEFTVGKDRLQRGELLRIPRTVAEELRQLAPGKVLMLSLSPIALAVAAALGRLDVVPASSLVFITCSTCRGETSELTACAVCGGSGRRLLYTRPGPRGRPPALALGGPTGSPKGAALGGGLGHPSHPNPAQGVGGLHDAP